MKAKIQNFVSDGSLTIEEKVSLMKTQLNTEAKCLMEELLKQGYCKDEVSIPTTAATLLTVPMQVLELFLRCANDLSLVHRDGMFKKTVRFSDEPPDSYLYEARNVWSVIDVAEVEFRDIFFIRAANDQSAKFYNYEEGPLPSTTAFTFKTLLRHEK